MQVKLMVNSLKLTAYYYIKYINLFLRTLTLNRIINYITLTISFTVSSLYKKANIKGMPMGLSIEPINIGIGKGYSVKKIATIIKKITSFKGEILWDKNMSNGAMKKVLNNEKMMKIIKWRGKTEIESGIAKTISWYSNSLN